MTSDPMIQAIVDHVADQWWLRDDKREEFRAALLSELARPRKQLDLEVSEKRVSRPLVLATRAVGLRRAWIGFDNRFDPDTIFRPRRLLRLRGRRAMVRQYAGTGEHRILWLELFPYRDPAVR